MNSIYEKLLIDDLSQDTFLLTEKELNQYFENEYKESFNLNKKENFIGIINKILDFYISHEKLNDEKYNINLKNYCISAYGYLKIASTECGDLDNVIKNHSFIFFLLYWKLPNIALHHLTKDICKYYEEEFNEQIELLKIENKEYRSIDNNFFGNFDILPEI